MQNLIGEGMRWQPGGKAPLEDPWTGNAGSVTCHRLKEAGSASPA
jgi:hypothetical protein